MDDTTQKLEFNETNFENLLKFYTEISLMVPRLRRATSGYMLDNPAALVVNEVASKVESKLSLVRPIAPGYPRGCSYGFHPILLDIRMI